MPHTKYYLATLSLSIRPLQCVKLNKVKSSKTHLPPFTLRSQAAPCIGNSPGSTRPSAPPEQSRRPSQSQLTWPAARNLRKLTVGESNFLLSGSSHQKLHTAPYPASHSTFPTTVAQQLCIQMTLMPAFQSSSFRLGWGEGVVNDHWADLLTL